MRHEIHKKMLLMSGLMLTVFLMGCSSTKKATISSTAETPAEMESALTTVVEGMSGQEIDRADLQNLGKKMQSDQETRMAVNAVVQTMQGNVVVKYCPVDGQRFDAKMTVCPVHHIELKTVEE